MKIAWYEPLFFLFFGAFHLHRVWGLADREGYAAFWLGVLAQKGPLYFGLMGLLAVLCLAGVATFFRNWGRNPWWRWIYLFGGGYVLFDLLAIAAGLSFWHSLLAWMFDVTSPCLEFSLGPFRPAGRRLGRPGSLASGAPHIGNGPVPYGTGPFSLFRVQNQPPSRLSCNSSAPHSSSAASPLVRGALRPPSSDSTPQVARLAAD